MANLQITTDWTASADGSYRSSNPAGDYVPSGFVAAYAPFPIEITQPQPLLDTNSYFYKQYTGLEYNVKVIVHGGQWNILEYILDTAPAGMVIDSATGVITWSNPVELGSPHNVTVRVTDGNTSDTVSYTLTVDATNALFLDATVVAGGAGTLADPMKDVDEWFLDSKSNSTYSGHQVYYKTGTYTPNSTDKNPTTGAITLSASKPLVHKAYPGHSPIFDMSLGFWFTDTQVHDVCFDGFTINNIGNFVASGEGVWFTRLFGDRHTYRRLTVNGFNDIAGSNNQAPIMAVSSSARNEYWSVSESYFDGSDSNGYAVAIFYRTDKSIVERVTFPNCAVIGVGHKTENTGQMVRGCFGSGTGKLYDAISFVDGIGTGNAEYSWNYGDSTEAFAINDGLSGGDNDFYYIRNTTTSPFYIREWIAAESDGIIHLIDNVVVGGSIYDSELTVDPALINESGTLLNAVETDFINPTTGLLIGAYAVQNDTKGFNGLGGQ